VDGAKRFFTWIKTLLHRRKLKKEKQEKMEATLTSVENLLKDFNGHYSEDNIQQRDDWIKWVNNQADSYNKTLENIDAKLASFESNLEKTS
jgi:antibiotic biosynthesis monooxygenase (ABM) superfamily enzyme